MKKFNIIFILLLITVVAYTQTYLSVNEKKYMFVYSDKKHYLNELSYIHNNQSITEYRVDDEILVLCKSTNQILQCDYNADGDFDETVIIGHTTNQVKWIIKNICKFHIWFS